MESTNHIATWTLLILFPVLINAQFSCNKADGFYPHPSDCTSYYICAVGQVYNVQCAAGLHFNAKMKYCDLPQNANCASYSVIPITQPTPAPSRTTSGFTFMPIQTTHAQTAAQTTQTLATQRPAGTSGSFPYWIFTSRPTSNKPYSPTTIHPTFPPFVTNRPVIIPTPNNICGGKSSGLYPDLSDCGHYYQCVYGLTIRQPCPPKLVFSDRGNTCDYPIYVPRCINYQYTG